MRKKIMKVHPALKHGGYSTTTILPGEDPVAFKELHEALIAELIPSGALEQDIVATIARLIWRKRNLITFQIAKRTLDRWNDIQLEIIRQRKDGFARRR